MTPFRSRPLAWDDVDAILCLERRLYESSERLDDEYVRICCGHFCDSSFVVTQGGRVVGYLLSFICQKGAYCTRVAVAPDLGGIERSAAVHTLMHELGQLLVGRGVAECAFTTRIERPPSLGSFEPDPELDELGDFRVVARFGVSALGSLVRTAFAKPAPSFSALARERL